MEEEKNEVLQAPEGEQANRPMSAEKAVQPTETEAAAEPEAEKANDPQPPALPDFDWQKFAVIFPDVAEAGQLAPEVTRLIESGVDPIAAQAAYENHLLQQQLKALQADLKNSRAPGSAAGVGDGPADDPFLNGLDAG